MVTKALGNGSEKILHAEKTVHSHPMSPAANCRSTRREIKHAMPQGCVGCQSKPIIDAGHDHRIEPSEYGLKQTENHQASAHYGQKGRKTDSEGALTTKAESMGRMATRAPRIVAKKSTIAISVRTD